MHNLSVSCIGASRCAFLETMTIEEAFWDSLLQIIPAFSKSSNSIFSICGVLMVRYIVLKELEVDLVLLLCPFQYVSYTLCH